MVPASLGAGSSQLHLGVECGGVAWCVRATLTRVCAARIGVSIYSPTWQSSRACPRRQVLV